MISELLWIVGLYVAAAALAHLLLRRASAERRRHYVLVAGNHQLQIEWYVRALQHFSKRTGTDIGITVVLDNSWDDTGRILERFARGYEGIGLIRTGGESRTASEQKMLSQLDLRAERLGPQQIVWVDLGEREHLSRLPL